MISDMVSVRGCRDVYAASGRVTDRLTACTTAPTYPQFARRSHRSLDYAFRLSQYVDYSFDVQSKRAAARIWYLSARPAGCAAMLF